MKTRIVVSMRDHQLGEDFYECLLKGCLGVTRTQKCVRMAFQWTLMTPNPLGGIPIYDWDFVMKDDTSPFWDNKVILSLDLTPEVEKMLFETVAYKPDTPWLNDLREKVLEFSDNPKVFTEWLQDYLLTKRP